MGTDPYGFIGKLQALSCELSDSPTQIVKLLVGYPRMIDEYITAAGECASFNAANTLAKILPSIDTLDDAQAQRLVSAYNDNSQLSGSYCFSGEQPHRHGGGLPKHLLRLTGRKFKASPAGRLREV